MEGHWSLILNAAVCLISVLLLAFCVPLLRARLGEERFAALQERIAVAVRAAEQLFGSGEGQKKKDFVLSTLLESGLVKQVDEVTALLESEVYQMKHE